MSATTASVPQSNKTVGSWRQAQPLLEQWRRDLVEVDIMLKQPWAIGPISTDSASGEPIDGNGKTENRFRGQIIYFTDADVIVRRPSGEILVLGSYEIAAMSDEKNRFELAETNR
jgi:hypothetical protein